MKKTLLDASSAILLFKAGLLKELTNVYHVFVTGSVLQELTRKNHHGTDTFLRYVSLQKIRVMDGEEFSSNCEISVTSLRSLDQGERDTIKCFEFGNYDFIITDDGKAARYCKENGLPFINALLFPRLLVFAGFMSWQESNDKMDAIISFGRYSTKIIEWARSCQKESIPFAIPGAVA
jgi:predicted nucleic acid-binding protein